MKGLTHSQYAKALAAAHPSYELRSQYTNGRSYVVVYCADHCYESSVIARSLTTSKQALKCCGDAQYKANQLAKSIAKLPDQVAKHGRLMVVSVDGYKNNRSKILCRCNECGEAKSIEAANATMGQGIDCACRFVKRQENGRKVMSDPVYVKELVEKAVMARGWRNPVDTVENALNGSLVDAPTYLYLYESPLPGLYKYGISIDPERRARNGGYGERVLPLRKYVGRAGAVLIEQAYKYGYGLKPPEELREWCGRSELTDGTPEEFDERIEELEIALLELGAEAFAATYCGYDRCA